MWKYGLVAASVAGIIIGTPAPASAQIIGDVAACDAGKPSILIRVHGFKDRSGEIRVSLYGDDPEDWLEGDTKLKKLRLPVPASGPVDICVSVPRPGTYAFGVTHDVEGDGSIGRKDGGAFSNNPGFTIFDREPAYRKAAFEVGNGTKRMGIRLMYLKGLSIRPWN